MRKIMKMNGIIINENKKEKKLNQYLHGEYINKVYDWTCGETEFNLLYDKDGDLYGIIIDNLEKEIYMNIIEEPYNYDFPFTLKEYEEDMI